MRRRSPALCPAVPVAFLLAASLAVHLLAPQAAHAQQHGVVAAYRPPPPPLPPAADAPTREPDDLPRRQFELAASGLLSLVRCGGAAPADAASADPCARLGAATGASLAAFYRPSPRLSLGAAAQLSRFTWEAPRTMGEGAGAGEASWSAVGLAARAHLFEDGAIDPHVGVLCGMAFLSMRAERAGQPGKLWREGLVTEASLGVDFWLSPSIKLGPGAALLWQPTGATERCEADVCLGAPWLSRNPDHALRLGATVTFVAGDEL
jgi:hypothetical protein